MISASLFGVLRSRLFERLPVVTSVPRARSRSLAEIDWKT
jgi:hypothetical protein